MRRGPDGFIAMSLAVVKLILAVALYKEVTTLVEGTVVVEILVGGYAVSIVTAPPPPPPPVDVVLSSFKGILAYEVIYIYIRHYIFTKSICIVHDQSAPLPKTTSVPFSFCIETSMNDICLSTIGCP